MPSRGNTNISPSDALSFDVICLTFVPFGTVIGRMAAFHRQAIRRLSSKQQDLIAIIVYYTILLGKNSLSA